MRYLRKGFLVAVMAAVAAALMISTASAQESLEVSREPAGGAVDTHCEAAGILYHRPSAGNCTILAETESGDGIVFFQHTGTSEVLLTECNNEFEAIFNEDGVGAIYNQLMGPEAGDCAREPCDEGLNLSNPHVNFVWPAEFSEPVGGVNQERLEVDFCLYAHNAAPGSEGSPGVICNVVLNVTHFNHAFEFSTAAHDGLGNGGTPCTGLPIELEGHWLSRWTDSHPASIELNHHDN